MKKTLLDIWNMIVNFYTSYSEFVHSILPGGIGDYIVALIDLAVAVLVVWIIAKSAFRTNNN